MQTEGMFLIYHIPSPIGSLVLDNKLETKDKCCTASVLLYIRWKVL